jgi:hypothetical protein
MTDQDKRKIVEGVGLEWHEIVEVYKGIGVNDSTYVCCCGYKTTSITARDFHIPTQLDPLDPGDMYGKIWPAFMHGYDFLDKLFQREGIYGLSHILTSPPDLAKSLLDYFNSKEEKETPTHRSRHNYQNGCTCGEIFEFVADLEKHLKEAK